MHLWPAVPTAPNTTAGMAKSRLAVSSMIIALLPPNSRIVFPNRLDTVELTWRPIDVDPVNETRGKRLSLSIFSPTTEPWPMTEENIPV